MSVAKGIAQAKTYSGAYTVLSLQILAVAVLVGAYGQHWWWGVFVPFIIVLMSMNQWTRLVVLIALSGFWAFLFQQLTEQGGAGFWSYAVGLGAFAISYGINSVGMIGLDHSMPDLA